MSGLIEIRFPEDQQEGTEATVTRWLVAEGDNVVAHVEVVEIETDKVVMEVPAPTAGRNISNATQTSAQNMNSASIKCAAKR